MADLLSHISIYNTVVYIAIGGCFFILHQHSKLHAMSFVAKMILAALEGKENLRFSMLASRKPAETRQN